MDQKRAQLNGRAWTRPDSKDGRPVFVLRKMVQGRAYTVYLDARGETEAEAELALFLRDPEGDRTRQETRQLKQEAAVYITAETVDRFLESMRNAGTTARYVGNVGFYLATWARSPGRPRLAHGEPPGTSTRIGAAPPRAARTR